MTDPRRIIKVELLLTDDRPTIDRDALTALLDRTHYTNVAGGEGGDILSSLTRAVDDLLDALDAETHRADALLALNDRTYRDHLVQMNHVEAERNSLGARISAVRALCDDPDTPHAGSCASYRVFRTADGPYHCDCIVSQIRRALDDTDAAHTTRETL